MNPDQTLRGNPELRKVILAALVGTVIEWYDFFLYGTVAALVFAQLFFPKIDPLAGTMAAFATYAVGFVGRPLGGVLFGYIGDRYGRKVSLVWTLSLMGIATFLIGCLPTYTQILPGYGQVGVLAPILLVAVRFVQGIAVGGEWGGAVLLSVESGHRGRRGFLGSWTQAGVPMGLLISLGVFGLARMLPEPDFFSWGWRLPFMFGIVLTIFGFIVRHSIQESPLFQATLQPAATDPAQPEPPPENRNPILAAIASDWRAILIIIGARLAENSSFYIFTVFVLSYGKQLKIPEHTMLINVALAAAVEFFVIPLYGMLSDTVGRRPVCAFGAVNLILLAYPFFWLLQTHNPYLIGLALVGTMNLTHAAMYAPQAAFFSELFGTRVRFSGVSLGYQLSGVVAGGCAPLIATALLAWAGGSPWAVALYLVIIAIITALTVLVSHETHRADLTH